MPHVQDWEPVGSGQTQMEEIRVNDLQPPKFIHELAFIQDRRSPQNKRYFDVKAMTYQAFSPFIATGSFGKSKKFISKRIQPYVLNARLGLELALVELRKKGLKSSLFLAPVIRLLIPLFCSLMF